MQQRIRLLFGLLFTTVVSASAQPKVAALADSLQNRDYAYLRSRYAQTRKQPISLHYATAWLSKSKKEQHYEQMALAYQALLHKSAPEQQLTYADSVLSAAALSGNDASIGAAYLTKGTLYYGMKNHTEALHNFLLADVYIARTDDAYLAHKTKYTIAQTKYYLGFYHEAIALFRECVAFFKEENDRAYLNSIHNLGLCYNKIGSYATCSRYNTLGLEEGKRLENAEMVPYFMHSEGINQFFLKDYQRAILQLQRSLPEIIARGDFANQIVALFYLGKAHLAVDQRQKAFDYFKKVDASMQKKHYIRPDLRENYELLIKEYKRKGELKMQLQYVNSLLAADSILHQNFKYLSGRIHKEYDTSKLLEAKNHIEERMKWNSLFFIVLIGLLGTIASLLLYRQYQKIKRYDLRFEALMADKKEEMKFIPKEAHEDVLDIAPEVVEAILKRLEKFEQNKKYLEKDMTSARLAALLKTNTKYVSKILPRYRGRKTIDYISDLKIAYIVELLKNERRYRNYTNKGLAETAGFGSTQNFTRAFKARTQISPTYFIKKLKAQSES